MPKLDSEQEDWRVTLGRDGFPLDGKLCSAILPGSGSTQRLGEMPYAKKLSDWIEVMEARHGVKCFVGEKTEKTLEGYYKVSPICIEKVG